MRPPGTLGYVSYFATYLLSVIFAGVALALIEKSRAWRGLGIAAGVLGTWALVLTGTRAAMLGLGCSAALLVVWLRPRIRARGVVGGLVAVAAIAGFYFSPAGQMLRSRTQWFVEDPLGGGRPMLWRDSIRMAAARWAVGFGPETFPIHFPRYQSEELAKAYPDYYQESPHNIFIDALAGQGAPGAVALAGITLLGFYAVWKMRDRKLAAALAASLGAVLVSQQFTAFTMTTALFFYLTVALAAGQAGEPARVPVNHPTARRACTALLSLVFIAYAASLVYADANLARVDRLIRAGRPIDAATVYDGIERWSPPGMRTDLWYSQAMFGAAGRAKIPPDAVSARGMQGSRLPYAPPTLPRNGRTPGTTWRCTTHARTIFHTRSKACGRRSTAHPTGSSRTGCWRKCYAPAGAWKKREPKQSGRRSWITAETQK